MTNAPFEDPIDTSPARDIAPQPGDVVLVPQVDGCCVLAPQSGVWQFSLASHADAVCLAVRYAAAHGTHAWVQTVENHFEPVAAEATPVGEIAAGRAA